MKTRLLLSLVALTVVGGAAMAHTDNARLKYALKIIAQDVKFVAAPTTTPDPTSVTDGAILSGILRGRTASFMLQQIYNRKGSIENGKLFEQEFTPGGLEDLTEVKAKERLEAFAQYLLKTKSDLSVCEGLLEIELKKKEAERDFAALKKALPDLDAFKP